MRPPGTATSSQSYDGFPDPVGPSLHLIHLIPSVSHRCPLLTIVLFTRITMESLPTEVIANIISFLPWNNKHVVKRVCREWKYAATIAIQQQESLHLMFED